jgi:hypothetical protein
MIHRAALLPTILPAEPWNIGIGPELIGGGTTDGVGAEAGVGVGVRDPTGVTTVKVGIGGVVFGTWI